MTTSARSTGTESRTDAATGGSRQGFGDAVVSRAPDATRGASVFSELLESEGVAVERTAAIVGLVIALIGAMAAAVVIAIGRTKIGVPLLALALVMTAYFGAVVRLVDRPVVLKVVRTLNPLIEMSLAPAVLVVLTYADGRAYALASWSPPTVFAGTLFVQTLRLRPLLPAVMGLYASAWHAAFYWWISPAMDPSVMPEVYAFGPEAQAHRCMTLGVGGLCAGGMGYLVRLFLHRGADRLRSQELFGKYRLGPKVAEGGMGEVLLATYCPEGGFERPVAIKRIHPHLARNPRFVDAFRAEAELCARLNHPNIVQVMDFGRSDGTYFFAMELVEGMNLSQLIKRAKKKRTPLPGGVVAFIGMQLCSALHHAHEEALAPDGEQLRVVHRDLTPRNVLVGRAGVVKITDFGIARVLRDAQAHQTQALMGSLAYLSPEQARSDPIDPRSDLFSVGLILRELLTGRNLFKRNNDAATLMAVLDAPIPSLLTERNDVDPAWAEVLSKALRREPDRRFERAQAFGSALAGLHEREGKPGAEALRAFMRPLLGDHAGGDAPELSLEDNDAPVAPDVLTATHDLRGTLRTATEMDATRPDLGGRRRQRLTTELDPD